MFSVEEQAVARMVEQEKAVLTIEEYQIAKMFHLIL